MKFRTGKLFRNLPALRSALVSNRKLYKNFFSEVLVAISVSVTIAIAEVSVTPLVQRKSLVSCRQVAGLRVFFENHQTLTNLSLFLSLKMLVRSKLTAQFELKPDGRPL